MFTGEYTRTTGCHLLGEVQPSLLGFAHSTINARPGGPAATFGTRRLPRASGRDCVRRRRELHTREPRAAGGRRIQYTVVGTTAKAIGTRQKHNLYAAVQADLAACPRLIADEISGKLLAGTPVHLDATNYSRLRAHAFRINNRPPFVRLFVGRRTLAPLAVAFLGKHVQGVSRVVAMTLRTSTRDLCDSNQGAMIATAVRLYQATHEMHYLREAEETADAALDLFRDPIGSREPAAFLAIFYRDVSAVDRNPRIRSAVAVFATAAWTQARDGRTGLFHFRETAASLLDQAAMVQIYAALAAR